MENSSLRVSDCEGAKEYTRAGNGESLKAYLNVDQFVVQALGLRFCDRSFQGEEAG